MAKRTNPRRAGKQSAHPSGQARRLAEVASEIDELNEEASLLFHLSLALSEFEGNGGATPPRKIFLDNTWVVPSREAVSRVQRLLSERSIGLRDRARDLLLLEVPDAP